MVLGTRKKEDDRRYPGPHEMRSNKLPPIARGRRSHPARTSKDLVTALEVQVTMDDSRNSTRGGRHSWVRMHTNRVQRNNDVLHGRTNLTYVREDSNKGRRQPASIAGPNPRVTSHTSGAFVLRGQTNPRARRDHCDTGRAALRPAKARTSQEFLRHATAHNTGYHRLPRRPVVAKVGT